MSHTSISTLYRHLCTEITSQVQASLSSFDVSHYLGSPRASLNISTPDLRKVLKKFTKDHADLSQKEWLALLDQLNAGDTFQEKAAVGYLLEYYPDFRRQIDPSKLAAWLEDRVGWGEVDVLCQSSFTPDDLLNQWSAWQRTLDALAHSTNINQRRASLVLLVKALQQSDDQRLLTQALRTLPKLETERHILITKAVSWVLRAMIKHHPQVVKAYLAEHRDTLPSIAYRETYAKLTTGRKTGQKNASRT